MWNARTAAELPSHRCSGHQGPGGLSGGAVQSLTHSPIESALLTLGGDGVVRCWAPCT